MKIAVFGLGYVGAVSAAALSRHGHDVIGVDVAEVKVETIRRGESPVGEPGLGALVREMVDVGRLTATVDGVAAVMATEVSLVCVGTPSAANGSLATEALERVMSTIGHGLAARKGRHTVVVRSTMLPGTSDELLIPRIEEASGLRVGRDFGFAANPEFLREGASLRDFFEPAKTVIGEFDQSSGDVVARLYDGFPGTVIRLPIRAAEMAKYVDNAFHALKIAFANEVGAVCRAFELDSHVVMQSFLADTKLNLSPAYLTPGFAFGGSCLPKDLRAIIHAARHRDVDLPTLESILASNDRCIARVVDAVVGLGLRRVGVFGLAFKPGTDDLRESPYVELCERLLGKGFQLKIYDPQVSVGNLVGSNWSYIRQHIPHLSELLTDSAEEVLVHSEVCIVGAAREETIRAIADSNGRFVVDLVRLPDASSRRGGESYFGIAW